MNEKKYRLVCDMDGEWSVQVKVLDNQHLHEWKTVKTFIAKHRQGYEAAKQWMKEKL